MTKTVTKTDSVVTYVTELIDAIRTRSTHIADAGALDHLADEVFSLLTSRKFSHLSRRQASKYQETVREKLVSSIRATSPLRFYYDIGPGYHASSSTCNRALIFDVGLAELVLLSQVKRFVDKVREKYAPGALFTLVIDNLCGLYTNGVAVEDTEAYVRKLRGLIAELELDDVVHLLVESEEVSQIEYSRLLSTCAKPQAPVVLSEGDKENVERFLGRDCTSFEAELRVKAYQRTGVVTETLLASLIDGVRLTQRASSNTLGFRSFPGGDQRIQVGEVVLTSNNGGKIRPLLLTTRNRHLFDIEFVEMPTGTLSTFSWVICATPRAD